MLALFKMDLVGAAHGWGRAKNTTICFKRPTKINLTQLYLRIRDFKIHTSCMTCPTFLLIAAIFVQNNNF